MFGFLTELPGTFATMLRRTNVPPSVAAEPFHLPDAESIVTFQDFYLHIEKFKRENPSLQFGFIDDDNIRVLKGLADLYEGINDYMPAEDLNAIREYNAIQRKREDYQAFGQKAFKPDAENQEIRRAVWVIGRTNDLVDYKTLILGLGHSNPQDNLFSQLKNLPANANQSAQDEIRQMEAVWSRRRHLAYLSSSSLLTAARVLDKFETYLSMIDAEFILNDTYSQRVYEFWHGLSDDKKQRFNLLISKAKEILARERQNLAQAMICRLEVIPHEHLAAAASNETASSRALCDDIVLATILPLQKFGLAKVLALQKFRAKGDIERFKRIARTGLTYPLMRDFFDYIVRYGCDTQKQAMSELFNPDHYRTLAVQDMENDRDNNKQPAVQSPAASPAQSPKNQRPPVLDEMGNIFPQIKAAAMRYFAPARFRVHEELHASFLEKAVQFIENNGADCNISLACEQVYSHVVRAHIKTVADRMFPELADEKIQQGFITIAEYLFLCLGPERNFDEFVCGRAHLYALSIREAARQVNRYSRAAGMDEINAGLLENQFILYAANGVMRHHGSMEMAVGEARFDAYVFVQSEALKGHGVSQLFIDEFTRICKAQMKTADGKWSMANADLSRWIERQKQFILAKYQFIELLHNEIARIKSSMRHCSLFMSASKTRIKLGAIGLAILHLQEASSFTDLRRIASEISTDRDVTQKRSRFAFLEGRSTCKKNIINEIERMEHVSMP